jgi:hypothetical protein
MMSGLRLVAGKSQFTSDKVQNLILLNRMLEPVMIVNTLIKLLN